MSPLNPPSSRVRRCLRTAPAVTVLFALTAVAPIVPAAHTYQKPPQAILDVLNAPSTPSLSLSPTRDTVLLIENQRYPSIADMAQPMLRLAGLRINPRNNGPHRPGRTVGLTLKSIATGKETPVQLPADPNLGSIQWSYDGKQIAFTHSLAGSIELWVASASTGSARRISGLAVNAAYGTAAEWMPDNRTLLCRAIPAGRGAAPAVPEIPVGPNIQESYGRPSPAPTFQDLLQTPHDEDLFDYYAASQLVLVDSGSGKITPVGKAGVIEDAMPSPDGQHLLVVRNKRPYSYLLPVSRFPKEVEVWGRDGRMLHRRASLPLADQVPLEGVPTGPRSYAWRPNEPATLVWVEALDGGDTRAAAPFRDQIRMLKAPFSGTPTDLHKTQHRYAGIIWGEQGSWAFVSDYDRNRRWSRTFLLRVDDPSQAPRLVWDRSIQDRYNDPGAPMTRALPTGHRVIRQSGDSLFLAGSGASPQGDRPFLDRFSLTTLKSERVFQCEPGSYESVVGLLSDDATRLLTRYESQSDPPNYYIRNAGSAERKALTAFPNPAPQLAGISKQLVTYKRADGVQLSFTLYLPPGYKQGQRLPTVVWAYPREFNDPSTAGQVSGSEHRFTTISGTSHLFFLLQGYAILDDATMPVIGDPDTMNNTYVEQIVASAKAAIDKATEMGVTDPNRVGVGGHSYGAFMTANLLAHCDLFRAGVARSGAYNRSLTPFGFQSERRTIWEARDTYIKVSPFFVAHQIKEPILLIHGEVDNNSGTFPIQSERLYAAIKGNGGNVRYVTLPHESHGYAARESVEHTLYEMISWFDKHVKNAPAPATSSGH